MHLSAMVEQLNTEVDYLVRSQVTQPASEDFGGFLLSSDHVEPRLSGFGFSRLALAYVCRESRHYLSDTVKEALKADFVYMNSHQRPDGCFDLSGCNFASPPDTAFMINAVLNAWWVMEKRAVPEAAWLNEPTYRLINSAATGIAAGGFHTPNHRWAIASCLLSCAKITGRKELTERAEQYLFEGLDINEYGEFAERSSGNYNQVNDDQMIRLYMATGDTKYLEAAKANLEMMYAYIDPDDSVFTNNSTRQDNGRKVYMDTYYILYLMVGYLLKDPSLGAMAEWIWNSSVQKGHVPGGVEWLLLNADMDGYAADTPFDKPFESIRRTFPDSKIVRVRRGQFSYTLLEDKPNFLYFQNGSFSMYMVIYENLCDRRNFLASSLKQTADGYRMKAHAESWYYLPFYPQDPGTSDWWAMDNPHNRRKTQGVPLDTAVEITDRDDGIDVRIHTEGIDRLPLRVEIGFLPGCQVRGDDFLLEGKAGQSITMRGGDVEVKNHHGEIITLSPTFGRHNVQSRSGGAYPQSPDHFTLYMTDYTPVDRTFHIGAKQDTALHFPW
ncbi:MAG TPA: hypothetical protein PK537_04250 [Candidatus Limiplasma sp.]|nr:hypothetical protein [Candidatus Limiplasma sp.]